MAKPVPPIKPTSSDEPDTVVEHIGGPRDPRAVAPHTVVRETVAGDVLAPERMPVLGADLPAEGPRDPARIADEMRTIARDPEHAVIRPDQPGDRPDPPRLRNPAVTEEAMSVIVQDFLKTFDPKDLVRLHAALGKAIGLGDKIPTGRWITTLGIKRDPRAGDVAPKYIPPGTAIDDFSQEEIAHWKAQNAIAPEYA